MTVWSGEKGADLLVDSLIYIGVVFVAAGLGLRWDTYMADNPFAILFYGAALFAVYVYWVARPHRR